MFFASKISWAYFLYASTGQEPWDGCINSRRCLPHTLYCLLQHRHVHRCRRPDGQRQVSGVGQYWSRWGGAGCRCWDAAGLFVFEGRGSSVRYPGGRAVGSAGAVSGWRIQPTPQRVRICCRNFLRSPGLRPCRRSAMRCYYSLRRRAQPPGGPPRRKYPNKIRFSSNKPSVWPSVMSGKWNGTGMSHLHSACVLNTAAPIRRCCEQEETKTA